ncbi:MAG: zinc ribbon domain-containing protein [Lachnospiraceae bacterium]|nr:zinc ribbon domain-containing protein [Lachnospiraceae bacterium]
MFCKKCGSEIEEGAAFCSKCGTPVEPSKVFCPGCGQEINDAAQFCPKCGTRVKSGINFNTSEIASKIGQASEKGLQAASKLAQSAKNGTGEFLDKVKNSDNVTLQSVSSTIQSGRLTPVMLLMCLIQIVQLILWFIKSIYSAAPSFGLKETFSMYECCEQVQVLNVITVILLLVSVILSALAGFGKQIKVVNVIGIIVQVWYLGWMLIEKIGIKHALEDGGYSGMMEAGLLGTGKFMMFISIVALIVYAMRIILAKRKKL